IGGISELRIRDSRSDAYDHVITGLVCNLNDDSEVQCASPDRNVHVRIRTTSKGTSIRANLRAAEVPILSLVTPVTVFLTDELGLVRFRKVDSCSHCR